MSGADKFKQYLEETLGGRMDDVLTGMEVGLAHQRLGQAIVDAHAKLADDLFNEARAKIQDQQGNSVS